MELIGTKVTAMILLGLLKLGCGLLPIFLVKVLHFKKTSTMDKFMGIILCIGGGVLLSTVFIHMIPEVRESLAHAGDLGYMPDAHYAFAELIICLGFFLVYGVEALVHRFIGGHGHSHGVTMTSQAVVESRNTMELCQGVDNGGFEQDLSNQGGPQKGHTKAVSGEDNPLPTNGKNGKSPFVQNGKPKSFQSSGNVYNVSSATLTSYMSYSDGDSVDTSLPSYMPRPNRTFNTLESLAKEKNILVTIRNFLIVIALSIHSVFEGMAIGLQMTSPDVWKLFTAVSIHAWAILFCIGMDMIVEGTKRLHIVFNIVILALTTPLGIVIGILVTEHVDEKSGIQAVVIGVLQGLAAGTLLYVSFYEVLEKDKLAKAGMTGLLGFFFIFFGFSVMAGLQAIGGGHSHGGPVDRGHGHSHGSGGSHAHHDDDHHQNHAAHRDENHMSHLEQRVRQALEKNNDHHGHSHDHQDQDVHHGHSHGHGDHDDPHGHSHDHQDHEDPHGHSHGHGDHDEPHEHGDHDDHHGHSHDHQDSEDPHGHSHEHGDHDEPHEHGDHDDHHGHSHDHQDHEDPHGHSHEHRDHDDHHGHSHDHDDDHHGHSHDHKDKDDHDHTHKIEDHDQQQSDKLEHDHKPNKDHDNPKHNHENQAEDPSFLRSQVQLDLTNDSQEMALNRTVPMKPQGKHEHDQDHLDFHHKHDHAHSFEDHHLNHDHSKESKEASEHDDSNPNHGHGHDDHKDDTKDHDHQHHNGHDENFHENEGRDHGHEIQDPNTLAAHTESQEPPSSVHGDIHGDHDQGSHRLNTPETR